MTITLPLPDVRKSEPLENDTDKTILDIFNEHMASNHLALVYSRANAPIGLVLCPNEQTSFSVQSRGIMDIVAFSAWFETYKFWIVGDAYNLGDRMIGEMLNQIGNTKSMHTIGNWASCCKQYSHDEREWVGEVDWSIFYEIQAMPDKRERAALLTRCKNDNLTVKQVRALLSTDDPAEAIAVHGVQRFDIKEVYRLNLVNEDEYAKAFNSGKKFARLDYTITWE